MIEVLHHCSVAEGMTLFIPVAVLSVAPLQYSVGVASFIRLRLIRAPASAQDEQSQDGRKGRAAGHREQREAR